MNRLPLRLLLAGILTAGCAPQPTPRAIVVPVSPDVAEPAVEVPPGKPDPGARVALPFTITEIYRDQQATETPPYHAAGGDCTYFDCQAGSDRPANFTVGVATKGDATDSFAWGRAVLIVPNREAGARFVELMAAAFRQKLARARASRAVLEPFTIETTILGNDLRRNAPGAGLSGKGGGWTATKWFPESDGLSAEVFFNYNLQSREGEFSEKEPEYRSDLIAILIAAVRDGPRPERTPDTDSNLTLAGPKIEEVQQLLSGQSALFSFSPGSKFAVFQDDVGVRALALEKPRGEPVEVARFDHPVRGLYVAGDDLSLLVQEGVPVSLGVKTSDDPMKIWWVDGPGKEKTLLQGPERSLGLTEFPMSPDHRFVMMESWKENSAGTGRHAVIIFLDRSSGVTQVVDAPGKNLSAVGWEGGRAVLMSNRWGLERNEKRETYLANPMSGALEREDRPATDRLLNAPDGKHRVELRKGELVVIDVPTGKERVFKFHEDDVRHVDEDTLSWVSPRYLRFIGPRLALIDVTTLKMNYPGPVTKGKPNYEFSPDFRWVLYQSERDGKDGLYLGRVVTPRE